MNDYTTPDTDAPYDLGESEAEAAAQKQIERDQDELVLDKPVAHVLECVHETN